VEMDFVGKNKKLAPTYIGMATFVEVNDTVAKLKMPNNNIKALNVNKLKHFFPADEKNLKSESDSDVVVSFCL